MVTDLGIIHQTRIVWTNLNSKDKIFELDAIDEMLHGWNKRHVQHMRPAGMCVHSLSGNGQRVLHLQLVMRYKDLLIIEYVLRDFLVGLIQ